MMAYQNSVEDRLSRQRDIEHDEPDPGSAGDFDEFDEFEEFERETSDEVEEVAGSFDPLSVLDTPLSYLCNFYERNTWGVGEDTPESPDQGPPLSSDRSNELREDLSHMIAA
jgi:hypothetical protein